MKLTKEISDRIASHIKSVQKKIKNLSAVERKDILQSIEAHIHDALNKKNNKPTMVDLDEVLAGMDPPELYIGESGGDLKRRIVKLCIGIAVVIILSFIGFTNKSWFLSAKQVKQKVNKAVMVISKSSAGELRVHESLNSLKDLNQDIVVKELTSYLSSKVNTVRRSAIYILWQGGFKDIKPAVKKLMELCSHREEFTRGMAALALGEKKIKSSFNMLCDMTLKDKSSYARRCGAYSLGLLGDNKAVPVLEKAKKDSDKSVRANVAVALKMISTNK